MIETEGEDTNCIKPGQCICFKCYFKLRGALEAKGSEFPDYKDVVDFNKLPFAFMVSGGSTGHLRGHFKSKHNPDFLKHEVDVAKTVHTQSIRPFLPQGGKFKASCFNWMINSYQPFTEFNNPDFIDMIRSANSNVKVPSAYMMKDMTLKSYNNMMQVLPKLLGTCNGISITVDGWTSPSNYSVMGMTAHFIDDNFDMHHLAIYCGTTSSKTSTAEDEARDVVEVFNL